MTIPPDREVAARELVDHLRQSGFGPAIEALNDPASRTKGGRVNVSAVSRMLSIGTTAASKMLADLAQHAAQISGDILPRK